ncbi:MBL fold metallo-hydrolase [Yeosuana sp. MJ-SS3]|uniref:MBL fold metallo-hydrolase n=1 Tax=Gilvirhabdus luticola TaxID=3079858 RepID=A0ABU3U738_9FLAO|nr:MBL fold metallo-hydrolase [Yeosuana sp. MJ-SS3]MDU8886210.1 MBL fold metallo-hydrolase [Yeosuana sp. MJ-SS3]
MKNSLYFLICISFLFFNCKTDRQTKTANESDNLIKNDTTSTEAEEHKTESVYEYTEDGIKVSAISHATMVLEYNDTSIYIDPVGGKEAFKGFNPPTFAIITDIHGDHLNVETLQQISTSTTIIIGPRAVAEQMPEELKNNFTVIFNGLSRNFKTSKIELNVEAIPMYNLPEDENSRHPKGRGNGYILTINGKRIYISGDTEDIPEMRQLKNIDMAFVCMNLPYTMTVDSAASAVLQFNPKEVFPYHYRGQGGLSDVDKFKNIINSQNSDIKVIQLDWYH